MLTYGEARKFYDAFAEKQDKQFYEESATNLLLEQGRFDKANSIVEFGCGTGTHCKEDISRFPGAGSLSDKPAKADCSAMESSIISTNSNLAGLLPADSRAD